MKKNNSTRVGSEAQYGPRIAGEILHDYLENSNEPLAVAYREHHEEADGWHTNTELGVDLKTILRSDRRAKVGKSYTGVLRRDEPSEEFNFDDPHFTFIETLPMTFCKRNPHVFDGRFITITRRDDGSLRLNFKELKMGAGFTVDGYAIGLYVELREALKGLVKEEMSE